MASLPWRWVAVTTVASVVGSEQTTTTAAPDIVDLIPSQIDLCSTSSDCCGDAQCLIPEGSSSRAYRCIGLAGTEGLSVKDGCPDHIDATKTMPVPTQSSDGFKTVSITSPAPAESTRQAPGPTVVVELPASCNCRLATGARKANDIVCGADGVTYANRCLAGCYGRTSRPGPCATSNELPANSIQPKPTRSRLAGTAPQLPAVKTQAPLVSTEKSGRSAPPETVLPGSTAALTQRPTPSPAGNPKNYSGDTPSGRMSSDDESSSTGKNIEIVIIVIIVIAAVAVLSCATAYTYQKSRMPNENLPAEMVAHGYSTDLLRSQSAASDIALSPVAPQQHALDDWVEPGYKAEHSVSPTRSSPVNQRAEQISPSTRWATNAPYIHFDHGLDFTKSSAV